jgi:hypothetical protein
MQNLHTFAQVQGGQLPSWPPASSVVIDDYQASAQPIR